MSRAKITTPNPVAAGRSRIIVRALDPSQPLFVQNLTGRSKLHSVITQGSSVSDTMRSGDIRVQDIVAGSITTIKIRDAAITTAKIEDLAVTAAKIEDLTVTTGKIDNLAVTTAKIDNLAVTNAKINDLSAEKITTGTLDAGNVTITSDDGKMTLSGNILQIKNASNTIQITIGKYDGTNYGMAFGDTPASPSMYIRDGIFSIGSFDVFNARGGANIKFYDPGDTNYVSMQSGQSGSDTIFELSDGSAALQTLSRLTGKKILQRYPYGIWYLLNGSADASNVTGDGTEYIVTFDTVISSNNMGSSFNTSTGVFTIPSGFGGLWLCCASVTISGIGGFSGYAYIKTSGTTTPSMRFFMPLGVTGDMFTFNITSLLYAVAGDTVSIAVVISGGSKTVDVKYGSGNTSVHFTPLINSI